jgi:UDPglucose 6-dehydrogenase
VRLSILGCGYVGLVTGACLAEIGHEVLCTDNDAAKIRLLDGGTLPIYEPNLDDIILRNRQAQRLAFTSNIGDAVRFGEAIFICVGTPPMQDGDADLSSMDSAARIIAAEARSSKLVVEKSTVPMQTGQKLKRALAIYARNSGCYFSVASNPEFLCEGTAVSDFLHPDRIVVGVGDQKSEMQLREIYRPLVEQTISCPIHAGTCPTKPAPPLLVTSISSAELIKHASNSFLALKISYANLIADICENMGADVSEVVQAVGLDSRIGPHFLRPGLGFGGFCLPKDIQAFIRLGEKAGADVSLLKDAECINKRRIDRFLSKARHALWTLKDKRIGILGLAFKPGTDDIRFAPSIDLIRRLTQEGAEIRAYDPEAMEKSKVLIPAIHYCDTAYQAADGADAVMIVTEWPQFRDLDWRAVEKSMARPLILDGRNLLNSEQMRALGFEYQGIGKSFEELQLQAAASS